MVAAAVFGLVANAFATDAATTQVPVAAHALVAGTIIAEADLTEANLPAARVYASTPRSADEVIGKRLNRPMRSGAAFNSLSLKAPNTVERNSMVTVLFRRPGIELSSTAVALDAGSEGKAIRVLNTENRTTMVATISGPGTVTIGDQ